MDDGVEVLASCYLLGAMEGGVYLRAIPMMRKQGFSGRDIVEMLPTEIPQIDEGTDDDGH